MACLVRAACIRLLKCVWLVLLGVVITVSVIEAFLLGTRIAELLEASLWVAAPLIVFLFVLAFGVHIVVHELGHLAAAFLVGMPPVEFCVAWLRYRFESPNPKLTLAAHPKKLGGYVLARFPTGRALRLRWMIFVLGGSIANVVFAAALLLLAYWLNSALPNRPRELLIDIVGAIGYRGGDFFFSPRSPTIAVLSFFAVFGLYYAALNFAITMPGFDGKMLETVLTVENPSVYFRFCEVYSAFYGKRPREWGEAGIAQLTELQKDQSDDISCEFLLYLYHLDRGFPSEAKGFLDLAAARMCHRKEWVALWYECAYFYARHLNDVDAAKELRAKAKSRPGHEPQTPLRADAAILLVEGKHAEARDKAWQAIEAMKGCLDVGGAIAEREWLASLAIEAENRRAASASSGPNSETGASSST